MNIVKATKQYEDWLRLHIRIVEPDLRRWGKRRQIYMWGRKKSGARSSRTCADEKGTGCWAQRRRWRTRWRKIGECGGSAGRARLCQRFYWSESSYGDSGRSKSWNSSACGL